MKLKFFITKEAREGLLNLRKELEIARAYERRAKLLAQRARARRRAAR